ncbi:DUF2761 domain-containing protein (plasmid) [Xanthomonas oryzae pv. oryzicola]|uniref:DUF2761 domain-containing protein n=1 Tax=Xanthomonas oryzae TaxID=347 RepID=UPI00349E87D7
MKKQTMPYPPGFGSTNPGRVAVLVRDYAASDLNGDAPAYWYSARSSRTVGLLMTFFECRRHGQVERQGRRSHAHF